MENEGPRRRRSIADTDSTLETSEERNEVVTDTEEVEVEDDGERMRNVKPMSKFKNQILPAWIPVYDVGTLYWKLLILGLMYIPIGIGLNLVSNNLLEVVINYTDCINLNNETETCADFLQRNAGGSCECEQRFTISKNIDSQVYMYYGLTNFFQNHRMYVKSKDDNQLLGKIGTLQNPESPVEDCHPYRYSKDEPSKIIIPCGAIANSMFNDTITLFHANGAQVELKRTGIAWKSDKKYKFSNPDEFSDKDNAIWQKFTQPPDWGRTLWELDEEDPSNNGLENEDLIVWMRTAAVSNFRKPHRIVKETNFKAGEYFLKITYNYNTKSFNGGKSIILATTSPVMGTKNFAIGAAFWSTGAVSMTVALVFLYLHIMKMRSRRMDFSIVGDSSIENE